MINAGEYNKKIIFYKNKNEKVKDSDGFSIDQEVEVLKTYAKVKTTKGFTLIANNSDFEKAFTNFTIRYPKTEITRDMFLKYNNKIYTIEYLNNIDEANIELEIQAKVVKK
jgi:SPP1 family predicted phage head-tail adaptor